MVILRLMIYMMISMVLAHLMRTFVVERSKIQGPSMQPYLKEDDQVIIEKLSYRFRKPRRFDVVAFSVAGQKKAYYIKRIIAMPNEAIQIKKGHVYINDQKLEDRHGLAPIKRLGLAKEKIKLKADEYFVLGDNRNDSLDSRDPCVGAILKKDLVGRAWIKRRRCKG